jgi:predicted NodU family carbamoyl transferase
MIILGVNGSPYGGHDASACIIKDGEVCVIAEEERFTRKKHAYDVFPHAAIQYCLAFMGLSLDAVDLVAYSWDLSQLIGERWLVERQKFLQGLFPHNLFRFNRLPDCVFVPHHVAHAASTFWCSGFRNSSILIMDGQGEKASGVLAYGDRENGIKILAELPAEHSLGYLYKAASGFAGVGRENPGKLMGLSSYGKPTDILPFLKFSKGTYEFQGMIHPVETTIENLDNMEPIVSWWLDHFSNHLGLMPATVVRQWDFMKNEWRHESEQDVLKYADFAASVQHVTEKIGCHLVRDLIARTECPRVCLAGGVALNCSMNGRIALMPEVDDLFIFPASHDSGTSVGAALQLSFNSGYTPVQRRWESCYFGPCYENEEIRHVLIANHILYKEIEDEALYQDVAKLLDVGSIVAVFRGRSEIGPRALGNRSILAAPNSVSLRDRVNRTKARELWRPLCPSVLSEHAHEYFCNASKGSPFMLRFLDVIEDKKNLIPGVVHIDGTARAQLVDSNSDFGRLIEAYRQLSGLPMVLNTSFNLAGEPIVGSPIDALRSYFTSPIDALVLGNFLIVK